MRTRGIDPAIGLDVEVLANATLVEEARLSSVDDALARLSADRQLLWKKARGRLRDHLRVAAIEDVSLDLERLWFYIILVKKAGFLQVNRSKSKQIIKVLDDLHVAMGPRPLNVLLPLMVGAGGEHLRDSDMLSVSELSRWIKDAGRIRSDVERAIARPAPAHRAPDRALHDWSFCVAAVLYNAGEPIAVSKGGSLFLSLKEMLVSGGLAAGEAVVFRLLRKGVHRLDREIAAARTAEAPVSRRSTTSATRT